MKTIKLIVIFLTCLTYGKVSSHTTVRIGHKPEKVDNSFSSIANFGPFEQYAKPLRSSLQKVTMSICGKVKLCPPGMLDKQPFVSILGPVEHHPDHKLGLLDDLKPAFGQALEDILVGYKTAETDVIVGQYKAAFKHFTGLFGQFF